MLDAATIRPLQQGTNAYRVPCAITAGAPQTVGLVAVDSRR